MTEFITGLVLGGLLVFCVTEFHRWKVYLISQGGTGEKNDSNTQWHNLMNYNGSERGQMNIEN